MLIVSLILSMILMALGISGFAKYQDFFSAFVFLCGFVVFILIIRE